MFGAWYGSDCISSCVHLFTFNDQKGPEKYNYTIVKYGEPYYGRHTVLTPAVVKISLSGMSKTISEDTQEMP